MTLLYLWNYPKIFIYYSSLLFLYFIMTSFILESSYIFEQLNHGQVLYSCSIDVLIEETLLWENRDYILELLSTVSIHWKAIMILWQYILMCLVKLSQLFLSLLILFFVILIFHLSYVLKFICFYIVGNFPNNLIGF